LKPQPLESITLALSYKDRWEEAVGIEDLTGFILFSAFQNPSLSMTFPMTFSSFSGPKV